MATVSNQIRAAGNSPSKEQEGHILRQFGIEVGVNSYLHSLVSVELCEWFQNRMRQDVSCDVMAEMSEYLSQWHAAEGNHQAKERELESLAKANAAAALQFKVAQERAEDEARQERELKLAAEADLEILQAERDELRRRLDKLDVITQDAWFYGRTVSPEQLRSALTGPMAEQD